MQEVLDEADFDSIAPKDTTENIDNFESDIDSYKQDKIDTNKQQNDKTSESENNEKEETQKLGGDIEAIENEIYSLAETNPRLAMSQLGTQLEHSLRYLVHAKGETPGMSFYDVLDQLEKDPKIDSRFLNIADEIRQARNEAVHAAEFESDEMYGLIDVGLDLLRYINNVTKSDKIPDDEPPIENI